MNCVKGQSTCPILVGNLGQLRCQNCSDTKITLVSGGEELGICGAGKGISSLRTFISRGSISNAVNVTRAQ